MSGGERAEGRGLGDGEGEKRRCNKKLLSRSLTFAEEYGESWSAISNQPRSQKQ